MNIFELLARKEMREMQIRYEMECALTKKAKEVKEREYEVNEQFIKELKEVIASMK